MNMQSTKESFGSAPLCLDEIEKCGRRPVHPTNPGLHREEIWRQPTTLVNGEAGSATIVVSRWLDVRAWIRHETAVSPQDRHVLSIALKPTRLRLVRSSGTIFDGMMPSGMLHVTGPSQRLEAVFSGACDFIHFYVPNDIMLKCHDSANDPRVQPPPKDMNDFMARDALMEILGQTLVSGSSAGDPIYAEHVGGTVVRWLVNRRPPDSKMSALPPWRLRKVLSYIHSHIGERIGLPQLAEIAGLSRMHFAAQFRMATGYQPHEYILHQRVERAKIAMIGSNIPLVQVALSVGFQAQTHFTTVFKRLTGETPAAWRRNNASLR